MSKSDTLLRILFIILVSLFFSFIFILYPYASLIIVIFSTITVFVLKKKGWIFYLLLLLVPIDRFYFSVVYKLKLYQILLFFLLIAQVFLNLTKGKNRNRFVWNLLDVSILAIYFIRASSLFVSIDYISTLKSLMLNGFFVGLYFYIRFNEDSIEPQRVIQYMITTSIIFIIFGFLEFILGKLGFIHLPASEAIYVYEGRPRSVFREPDWFGGYLTFIIGLTLPFLKGRVNNADNFERIHKINKIILYAALSMVLLIVVRSAWLGLFMGVLSALVIFKKARSILFFSIWRLSILVLICLVFLSVFWFSQYKSIQDRFASIFTNFSQGKLDPAAQVRINSYNIILRYIYNKPLQGYGAGAWEFLSQRHKYVNPSLSTNNLLLTPIFEMGILGVLVYLIFFFALFKMIFKGIKYDLTNIEQRYVVGITIAVLATLVVSIFNDIMLTGFYWAFVAIFNNYIGNLKKKNGELI